MFRVSTLSWAFLLCPLSSLLSLSCGSLKECLIVVGILSGYLASYLLIDTVGGWRTMYGLSFFPAVGLLLGMVSPSCQQLENMHVSTQSHHQSCSNAPCQSRSKAKKSSRRPCLIAGPIVPVADQGINDTPLCMQWQTSGLSKSSLDESGLTLRWLCSSGFLNHRGGSSCLAQARRLLKTLCNA